MVCSRYYKFCFKFSQLNDILWPIVSFYNLRHVKYIIHVEFEMQ